MLGYVIYADRFAGSLRGVGEHIPYLKEMGVTEAKREVSLKLGGAESFATVEESRFPGKHLLEKADGVVEVIPLQGLVPFDEDAPQVGRNFVG